METSEKFRIQHNVTIRIYDKSTGKLVREHTGHNTATNTLIEGIGHYLAGEGVLRQGYHGGDRHERQPQGRRRRGPGGPLYRSLRAAPSGRG